ncbi:MAG: cytochrome P460 family protein [Pseudomonadota bacterium]
MKLRLAIGLICLASLAAQAADLAEGRNRSLGCQACHGSDGAGTAPDIPNLAGQKPGYLQAQLVAFRSKHRKHELMNAIAEQLSDGDIENLAAFWSSLSAGAALAGTDAAGATPVAQMRKSRMTFPAAFPEGFVMYHEELDAQKKPVKRSYASRAAVNAARAGEELPAGSAIVVENLANNQAVSYAAMESRAGWGDSLPELLRNGDWTYALFDGSRTLNADFNYAHCLACHKPMAESSYVFGLEAIRK